MRYELQKPDLAALIAGNTGTNGVWTFDSGKPGLHVAVSALVHGNELCGAWALKMLLDYKIRPNSGKLSLFFCNLAAFARFSDNNEDAARFADEDLNRVWMPHKLTDPNTAERRRAIELVPHLDQVDWLLDLHSMHEEGLPLLLPGLLPRNLDLARKMVSVAHTVVDAGHQEGTRLRDFGRFGEPTGQARALLVECGFHGAISSKNVAIDQAARFLVAASAVPRRALPAQWFLPTVVRQTVVHVTHAIVAQSSGLRFTQAWRNLQHIEQAGTLLAVDGDVQHKTPYSNCTVIMPSLRQLKPGVTVMRLARSESADKT